MSHSLRIRQVQVYRLAIPLRFRFEHAAAGRDVADPIVVQLSAEAPHAEHVGHGETLVRSYVTGESADSVVRDVERVFTPSLLEFHPESFSEALEFTDALPHRAENRVVNAARAAVELALIDLAGRVFARRAADLEGWLDLPGFASPGSWPAARHSGMVVGRTERKLTTLLRLQRLYGLRDFKIKVATEGWEHRLESAYGLLRRAIERDRATLRADANGAWSCEQARAAVPTLERFGVCALEQPLAPADDSRLSELAETTQCDLIADESLITLDDARRLIDGDAVRVFNIRIAKNGGLMPSLKIAKLALDAGRDVQLGCLVGETSILSAAGLAFLQLCPRVRFVEGAYGNFLLRGDVTRRPLRFRRGGRVRLPTGFGLGVNVNHAALERFSAEPARTLHL